MMLSENIGIIGKIKGKGQPKRINCPVVQP